MARLKVLTAPDPRLKICAKPVTEITEEILRILDDMVETLYLDDAVGLAATQVGVDKRLVVIDTQWTGEDDRNPIRMINPQMLWISDEVEEKKEACLSVPEQYIPVVRPVAAKVNYLDEKGQVHEIEVDGLLARCIQHEIDHLDGKLMIDYVSRLKQDMIYKKLKKIKEYEKKYGH